MVEPGSDEWNALPPREKAANLEQASAEARRAGNDQLACAYAIQSLNLYRGHDDRPAQARVLLRLVSLAGWADFGDGLNIFERIHGLASEANAIYEDLGDRVGMANAGLSLAVDEAPEQAVPRLECCVATLRELGKPAELAWGLNRLAARLRLCQKSRARELLEESLALYRSVDDRNGIATTLFSLAIGASEEDSLAMLEEALTLRRELGQRKRMAELLMMLGGNHQSAERWDAAELCFREGLEVCREIDIPLWQSSCMDRLADIERARGREEAALDWEARSREIRPSVEIDPEMLKALEAAMAAAEEEEEDEDEELKR